MRKVLAADPKRVVPQRFFVVIPLTSESDKERVAGVANGVLKGIEGISDRAEIIMQWLGIGRDAVLVMDGPELVKLNKMTRVQYDNPDYFISNDMAALRRVAHMRKEGWETHAARILSDYIEIFVSNFVKKQDHWAADIQHVMNDVKNTSDAVVEAAEKLSSLPEMDNYDLKNILSRVGLSWSEISRLKTLTGPLIDGLGSLKGRAETGTLVTGDRVKHYTDTSDLKSLLSYFEDALQQADEGVEYVTTSYSDKEAVALAALLDRLSEFLTAEKRVSVLREQLLQRLSTRQSTAELAHAFRRLDYGTKENMFRDALRKEGRDKIQTVKSLASFFSKNISKFQLSAEQWEFWLRGALETLGRTYSAEGEWIVKDKTLRVPPNSKLFVYRIKLPDDVEERLAEGKLTSADMFVHGYVIRERQKEEDILKDFGRYKTFYIDREKFEKARSRYHEKVAAATDSEERDPIPDDMLDALQMVDDGFADDGEVKEIEKRLENYQKVHIDLTGETLQDTYLIDDTIVEYDDGYVKIFKSKSDWLDNQDSLRDILAEALQEKFNENFQQWPGPLYHATTEEFWETIQKTGLKPMSSTRGLTNRGVGAAIFTVDDPDSLSESYGNVFLKIDVPAMKTDGIEFSVEQEPAVAESEAAQLLASIVEEPEYHWHTGGDGADDPATVILYVNKVPTKYISRIERR